MIVWVWLGNIFQLSSPQPWPLGSKSVRLFLSVAFPRIPCLSACQHLSCLLTNSGCCFCLPRVSWNRRKKKRSVSMQGSLGAKKETPLNAQFCIFDSILQTRCPLTCAYLWMWGCVSLWGIKTAWRELFLWRVNTFLIFQAFFFLNSSYILLILVIYQLLTGIANNCIFILVFRTECLQLEQAKSLS